MAVMEVMQEFSLDWEKTWNDKTKYLGSVCVANMSLEKRNRELREQLQDLIQNDEDCEL